MYRNVSLKLFDKSQIFNSSLNHLFNRLSNSSFCSGRRFCEPFILPPAMRIFFALVARIQKRIYVVGGVYQPVLIERVAPRGHIAASP